MLERPRPWPALEGGRILTYMADAGERSRGGRPTKKPLHGGGVKSTLKELGFSESRALRWQRLAIVPDKQIEELADAGERQRNKRPTVGHLTPTLKELGFSRNRASRWQRLGLGL